MTQPSITCPGCGRTSYNPNDIEQGYCGRCHGWTGAPPPPWTRISEEGPEPAHSTELLKFDPEMPAWVTVLVMIFGIAAFIGLVVIAWVTR